MNGRTAFAATLLAVAVPTGCYAGLQKATQVATTEPLDLEDNMPASDLSYAADWYEFSMGLSMSGVETFMGFGMDFTPRVNQRTAGMAVASDAIAALRSHIGAAYRFPLASGVELAPFGIVGADLVSLMFENDTSDPEIIESTIERSLEVGAQATFRADGGLLEPLLRVALLSQSGIARGEGYTSPEGDTEFSATGVMVTMGLNIYLPFGEER